MDTCKLILLLVILALPATSAASVNTTDNDRCQACHASQDIVKKGGERLYVDSGKFATTTHSLIGCRSCHDSVTTKHPADDSKPSKARCKECHAPIQTEYAKSLHGNKAICNDCHNPHEVKPPLSVSGDYINSKCAKCHDV